MKILRDFDRSLEDLREAVASASVVQRECVKRYVAMIKAIDVALALYYEEWPEEDKLAMRTAFIELQNTYRGFTEQEPNTNNVHELKR